MKELKTIAGFSNYAASTDGHIFYFKKNRYLSEHRQTGGYFQVQIKNDNGEYKRMLVHRLVAMTFIPNPNNYTDVDHIDGSRTNNKVENLRWCTRKQNLNFPIAKNRKKEVFNRADIKQKMRNIHLNNLPKTALSVVALDHNGHVVGTWASVKDAARCNGLNYSNVLYCCRGKRKTAGGYVWVFQNELDNKKQIWDMKKDAAKEFMEELGTLLRKYDASISATSHKKLKVSCGRYIFNLADSSIDSLNCKKIDLTILTKQTKSI